MTWLEILASGTVLTADFIIGYQIGKWASGNLEPGSNPPKGFMRGARDAARDITRPHRKGGPVKIKSPINIADDKERKVEKDISDILSPH